MSNPNALFLLADHIKLSLLERQRAQALNLGGDSQDGHISRSLDQFRDGLDGLDKERTRLEQAGDENKALTIADALPALRKQFDALTSQFHGFSSPSTAATLTRPNDPSLAGDFAHATTVPPSSSSPPPAAAGPAKSKPTLRATSTGTPSNPNPKTVRFHDARGASPPADADAQAAALFGRPYRDDPDTAGYRDEIAAGDLSNQQIHTYHAAVLAQQDEQLDELGASIGRQRELSERIGDELDGHVALLEEAEALTDRHQSRLDRAGRAVTRISRAAGESRQMVAIVVLIVVLVLLIAYWK